jgi:GDPmannose 4,6-dehydratase
MGVKNEKTFFYPRSPYAAAKLYAHWITINYRESYGVFACNGILFNHESPLRGETFVTKKIVRGLCEIFLYKRERIYLGNLYSKRDWGHAKDYVVAIWKMLQQKNCKDYVIATGKQFTVKEFIKLVAKELNIKLIWKGKGLKEVAIWNGKKIIAIDKKYFRPTEVDNLLGDASKARKELKWKPKYNIKLLVKDMVTCELNLQKNAR